VRLLLVPIEQLIGTNFRWRRGPHPSSLARTAMRSTTLHGTPLIQNCSAPRARRTDGSCSGTQDARPMPFLSFFCNSLPSEQRAGTSNSSRSRSLQSRSTTRRTVNHCSMSRPGASSSSCLSGRTPTTPQPKHNGLPWIVPPSVLSALASQSSLSVCVDDELCIGS